MATDHPPPPVSSREEAIERLSGRAAEIRALGVESLSLFGSILSGRLRPESDVDVLVSFAPGEKSYDNFIDLAYLLDDLLGRPVELVTRESLSPHIGPHILAEAEDVPVAS